MDIYSYLATNIPLFSASLVMIFIATRNLRVRKKESIFFLVFTGIVLFLSAVTTLEKYSQAQGLPIVGTIFTSLGYILRPILLYIFVLLANMDQKRSKRFYILCSVPLMINVIIYILPWFFGVPGVSTVVFSYVLNPDGTASFVRGGFLNFFSHAICVIYLVLLVYVSTIRFQGKHRRDGLVLVLCVAIIIATVVTEVVTGRNDLLNVVCIICAMINYIFIISVNSSKDPLTNLYDRRTYIEDVSKYKDKINGVIQIDMNELKYVNDTFGHDEGDVALSTISSIFEDCINPSMMCAYRLSGDEFVILMFQGKEIQLEIAVERIKSKIEECRYSVAIGFYFIDKKSDSVTFEEAMKKAEDLMYKDKNAHYIESGHNRR